MYVVQKVALVLLTLNNIKTMKIKRFLDSILKQTYNKIQLIFVNDGSIDAMIESITKEPELTEEQQETNINPVKINPNILNLPM